MLKRFISLALFISIFTVGKSAPRIVYTINESWNFSTDKQHETIVSLPHTWNNEDTSSDKEATNYYRGRGYYRKQIVIGEENDNKQWYIYFEGANQVSRVYVNKQFAGEHIGGYTRFCFDITPYLKLGKENLLEVEVNNMHSDSVPPHSADFTFFGGIYRDVYLIATSKTHISTTHYASSGVYITSPSASKEKATVRVKTHLSNHTKKKTDVLLKQIITDHSGKEIASLSKTHTLTPGDTEWGSNDITIRAPRLWSPDSPYLYTLRTLLYDKQTQTLLDEVVNPVGIRFFSFSPTEGFTLNGEPMKLIGTCRHQDYYQKGNALQDERHIEDIRLLKQMGGNFLRISHYPQDPSVMEMCDKLGILSSVEIPIVNSISTDKAFTEVCSQMLKEMMYQDFNRPSVIIWAYMNEVLIKNNVKDKTDRAQIDAYREKVSELAQTLENILRKNDPYRYTMIAFEDAPDRYKKTTLPEIPMIQGYNIYTGWYRENFEGLAETMQAYHNKYPDKILMLSEYGADVDTRLHAYPPQRYDYTVEYGNLFHRHYLNFILQTPYISGACIWNLNDFYSFQRKSAVPKVNNKGIVGLTREKKDTYYLYQAHLTPDPVLKIGSSSWEKRGGTSASGVCNQMIAIYANMDTIQLFHNGKFLGQRSPERCYLEWEVPFIDGINTVEAVGIKAGKAYRDLYRTYFQVFPMHPQQQNFTELNVMLGSSRYFEDKELNTIWVPEQAYTPGSWGYIGGQRQGDTSWHGKLPFVEVDVLGTNKDPLFQTQREGIECFRADVPPGQYAVYLYWAELSSKNKKEQLVNNLDNNKGMSYSGDRLFHVLINGTYVYKNLSPLNDFGEHRAAVKKYHLTTSGNEGINIQFEAIQGKAILNAIRIYKMY